MLISTIIITACFFIVVFVVLSGKINRAVISLLCALIVFFVLIFIDSHPYSIIVELLFGTKENDFVNLHSLILIVGIIFIVEIAHESGLIQFMAIYMIKLSDGRPIYLMVMLCIITVIISAILNNILTIIVLVPLTINLARILKINPTPYILMQAILVNIGASLFAISSIPNILITTSMKITFLEFFLNVGIISIIVFFFTLIFFIFLYKKELYIPQMGVKIIQEFDIWMFVPNKKLLYLSMTGLIVLMTLFIVIPSSLITPDIIALGIAIILIIVSRIDAKELFNKVDMELIFYLLGIFVISGALELIGIIDTIGIYLADVGGGDVFLQLIFILWFSAALSSLIDNIPITKVLIPIVGNMTADKTIIEQKQIFYGLAIGANWGDNFTPMGDNIIVVNVADQNKSPISMKQFFKLGFTTTFYQLVVVTFYFCIIFQFILGIIILVILVTIIIIILILCKYGSNPVKTNLYKALDNFRYKIIR
jgi:Na+/H+ antiporter NhaD/arsenite permease-like protein